MTNYNQPMTNERDSEMPDVFPDFAVSLEEAGLRIRMLGEFVRDHMTEGEDYGVIPGTSTKPTLFKPGAEKLNAIFGLAPIVEITNRVEDWDKGFVAYEIKVTLLNKRTTNVEAEGIGNCNSRERRYKNQDAANIANTILKMAKKRALIDATLSATRASGIFTQDLEDMEIERVEREDSARYERAVAASTARGENGATSSTRNGFVPAKEAREDYVANGTANSNVLTEAQRGAILAIANKVFGKNTKDEMAKMVDKPISQMTKSEASILIDKLRSMLPEQPQTAGAQSQSEDDNRFAGAGRNGQSSRN